MNNKKIILLSAVFLIFFLNNSIYANDEIFISKEKAMLIKKILEMPKNNETMPVFLKDFNADHIPNNIQLGKENETDEEILEIAQKYKPKNFDDYTKVLCPLIIKKTKAPKTSILPSIEELANKPAPPNFKNMRQSVRFLTKYISLLFENINNDNAAIAVIYAPYYIARDLEESYSGTLIKRMIGVSLCNIASNELLRWASKPKRKSVKLAKYLSKDLLELVKNEYPLSDYIFYEIGMLYSTMYDQLDTSDENKKMFVNYALKSDFLKEITKLFYLDPKKYIDKPYYLCINELEAYSKIYNDKMDTITNEKEKFIKLIEDIQKNSSSEEEADNKLKQMNLNIMDITTRITLGEIVSIGICNYSNNKIQIEHKLAQMEIAAIALAYNAYFCEMNKEPQTIDELESWFGTKLPINRFTGKPYIFNSEKGYIIYNYGSDNKKDDKNDQYKIGKQDIFFKFSAK